MKISRAWGLLALAFFAAVRPVSAGIVTIEASKDNTLFEDGGGALSGGVNVDLFVGKNGAFNGFLIKRSLVAFDVAGIVPPGEVVLSVTLQLNANKVADSIAKTISLHRALADWGEGTSAGTGGGGVAASAGDATWIHAFFGTATWASPGGDFVGAASATTSVGLVGDYTWGSTAQMVADVQGWVNNPAVNFGWVVKMDDEVPGFTAKRFGSLQKLVAAQRPQLTIEFGPPVPIPTVSQWGLAIMVLLVFAVGTIAFSTRRGLSRS